MGEVARLTRFRIDPARRGEVGSAYSERAAEVREESGIQVWELCTDVGDDNTIWLYVRAGNDSALEAHRPSAAADTLRSVLMPAIVGDPVFHDLVPLRQPPVVNAPD